MYHKTTAISGTRCLFRFLFRIQIVFLTLSLTFVKPSSASADVDCNIFLELEHLSQLASPSFYESCSGNGECNAADQTCKCDNGFEGLSDWINTDGLDCQINTTAIRVLWGLNCLFNLVYMFWSFPKILARYQAFRELQLAKKKEGIHVSIFTNRGLVACGFYALWIFPLLFVFCLIKIFVPGERIGVTFTVTLLFALIKFGFYFGVAFVFQPALIKTLLPSKIFGKYTQIQSFVDFVNRFAFLLMIFSTILGFLPFFTFAWGGNLNADAERIWILYLSGSLISLVFYALQALYIKKKIIKLFNKFFPDRDKEPFQKSIAKTQIRIVALQDQTLRQIAFQAAIYSLLLFWPYLWNKHDYFLPLSWLGFSRIGKRLADTYISSGHSSSGGEADASSPDINNYQGGHYDIPPSPSSDMSSRWKYKLTSFWLKTTTVSNSQREVSQEISM